MKRIYANKSTASNSAYNAYSGFIFKIPPADGEKKLDAESSGGFCCLDRDKEIMLLKL